MSTLPPTSGQAPLDDMMRQIDGRFDQMINRMDKSSDRMDRRLEMIERTMLTRSDLYPTLITAQLMSIGVWTVVIWGLARLGLFS